MLQLNALLSAISTSPEAVSQPNLQIHEGKQRVINPAGFKCGAAEMHLYLTSSLAMEIALFLHGLSHLAWPTFPDSGRKA